jgi:hypothetical protein
MTTSQVEGNSAVIDVLRWDQLGLLSNERKADSSVGWVKE